jgi:hypothetical protein
LNDALRASGFAVSQDRPRILKHRTFGRAISIESLPGPRVKAHPLFELHREYTAKLMMDGSHLSDIGALVGTGRRIFSALPDVFGGRNWVPMNRPCCNRVP